MTEGVPGLPPPAQGWLRLTMQPPFLGPGRPAPRVRIDDDPVPTQTGENVVPLPVGRHRVEVTPPWKAIHADVDVEVREGEVSELWYSPPFRRGHAGSIGPTPQPTHGPRFLILVGVIIVVGMIVTYLR